MVTGKKGLPQRMGGLCSKESNAYDGVSQNGQQKEEQRMVAPLKEEVKVGLHDSKNEGSARSRFKTTLEKNISSVRPAIVEENPKTTIIERPKDGHHRHLTMDSSKVERMYHVASIPHRATAEHVAVGWPSWLVSVAGEAIKGWTPRSTDSYEKLSKVCTSTSSFIPVPFLVLLIICLCLCRLGKEHIAVFTWPVT